MNNEVGRVKRNLPEQNGSELDTWEAFVAQLASLREKREKLFDKHRPSSRLLFRGQSNSGWELETSLERECQQPDIAMRQYFELITAVRPEIESQTEVRWNGVPDYPGYRNWLKKLDRNNNTPVFPDIPGYDYLAYLRHHGFPSPFLDWTRSPYIAAYFAFADADSEKGGERVSIYVYWEDTGRGKIGSERPRICCKGPYVRTHRRHFLQQSQFTFCFVNKDEEWRFTPHDKAFTLCNHAELDTYLSEGAQDLLLKFNIPTSEKWKVLKYLDEHNINGFSLYGSEEGLMKTLAMREMPLRLSLANKG